MLGRVMVALAVLGACSMPGVATAGSGPREVSYEHLPIRAVDVEVVMKVDATTENVDFVRFLIEGDAAVTRYAFVTRRDAYQERVGKRSRHPHVPKRAGTLSPADLPVSFRVDYVPGAYLEPRVAAIRSFPGVMTVTRSGLDVSGMSDQEIRERCTDQYVVSLVYLHGDATPEQIAGVSAAAQGIPGVSVVDFFDQQAALRAFQQVLGKNFDPSTAPGTSELPVLFRLLVPRSVEAEVAPQLRALPGVDSIETEPTCDAARVIGGGHGTLFAN